MRLTGLRAALVAVACLGSLSACSSDDVNTSTDPVEIKVGKAFEWNDYSIDDGWEMNGIKRSLGVDEVTTPEVKGTITNDAKEARTALFQIVFSAKGKALATVNCSAAKMTTGQSQQFLCPGLSATMPDGYDTVVVQEFSRDTSAS